MVLLHAEQRQGRLMRKPIAGRNLNSDTPIGFRSPLLSEKFDPAGPLPALYVASVNGAPQQRTAASSG